MQQVSFIRSAQTVTHPRAASTWRRRTARTSPVPTRLRHDLNGVELARSPLRGSRVRSARPAPVARGFGVRGSRVQIPPSSNTIRKVALKVLKAELPAVLSAERFVQEIKATARLCSARNGKD